MKNKLVRITTVTFSLEKLLEGQLGFMNNYYEVTAISAEEDLLYKFGNTNKVSTFFVDLTRKITPIKDLRALYILYNYLKSEKPLIVHTHTPKAGIIGMLAAYLARVPLRLHTVAGLPLMESAGVKRKILNFVEKLTYRCATNVYPNSKGLFDFIISEKFTRPEKLKIIGNGSSNGIDTTYFNPTIFSKKEKKDFKQKLRIPGNDFTFIFVGRMVTDKGINELVSAFQNILKRHSNVSLLLVGPFEDDLDPLLPSTMDAIHNSKKIICVGYQTDVRLYFAVSDVLTFPSYREGFPNVVMQAGAMDLPSIVSDINGCNEIVVDQYNGLIIPSKNAEALESAMLRILEEPGLNIKLKSFARAAIVKEYDRLEVWSHLLSEYKKLSEQL
jgi:glycosyltransferase involved in cell wall biosynthesis